MDLDCNIHFIHLHIELRIFWIFLLVHDFIYDPKYAFNLLALQFPAAFFTFFNFFILFL